MSEEEKIKTEEMEQEAPGARSESSFTEELTVAGSQLVREVERLISEGNVRRLIIKQEDRVILEVSLTLGVIGAGALAIFAPLPAVILAAVAVIAGAVAKVTVVIERTDEGEVNDMQLGGDTPPEE